VNIHSTLVWQDGLSFKVNLDGFEFAIDGDAIAGGKNLGPKPKGLVPVALAGCSGMDVISILQKMRQRVSRFEIRTETTVASAHPKKIESITVHYLLEGDGVDPESVKKAIELSQTKYCGVYATLIPRVTIRHDVTINGQPSP